MADVFLYLGKDELRYSLGIVERIGAKIAN